jgi:hypothetical protein
MLNQKRCLWVFLVIIYLIFFYGCGPKIKSLQAPEFRIIGGGKATLIPLRVAIEVTQELKSEKIVYNAKNFFVDEVHLLLYPGLIYNIQALLRPIFREVAITEKFGLPSDYDCCLSPVLAVKLTKPREIMDQYDEYDLSLAIKIHDCSVKDNVLLTAMSKQSFRYDFHQTALQEYLVSSSLGIFLAPFLVPNIRDTHADSFRIELEKAIDLALKSIAEQIIDKKDEFLNKASQKAGAL